MNRMTGNRVAPLTVLLCLALGSAIQPAGAGEFTVNSNGDESDAFPGDGVAEILPGTAITTLRAAIEEANAFPGPDIIRFATGLNIQLLAPLPPLSDATGGTTIDGQGRTNPFDNDTYPYVYNGFGLGAVLSGRTLNPGAPGSDTEPAIKIISANNAVKGMTILGFPVDGIEISGPMATGNLVRSCRIGIENNVSAGNGRHGIHISGGASGNTIGGATPHERNIIGANAVDGVHIAGAGTSGNKVLGNILGAGILNLPDCVIEWLTGGPLGRECLETLTRQRCTLISRPNLRNNLTIASGATGNMIGERDKGNIFTGSIWYPPSITEVYCSNYEYPAYCTVDPDIRPASGAGQHHIVIEGAGSDGNQVCANSIGFRHYWDITSQLLLSFDLDRSGGAISSIVIRNGASNNTIGGEGEGFGNTINYSLAAAVVLEGGGTSGNHVLNNAISGEAEGINLQAGAENNIIGSDRGWGNLIRSRGHGVDLSGQQTNSNRIIGNNIRQNGFSGIAIRGGANANLVGGTGAGEGNAIASNCSDGVILFDAGTVGNQILGNDIFDNGEIGVFLVNGASENVIGGSTSGAGNDIYGNAVTGVEIHDLVSTGNKILGNDIHGNGTRGVFMVDGTSGNIIGGVPLAERNRIYENELSGIELNGEATVENQIRLNSIFDNEGKGILLNFGANKGILPPVIHSFVPFAGTAPPNSFVDIFSDAAEEGKHHIGSTSTDAGGNFSVVLDLVPYVNTNLTATATDDQGDTSEFSLPITIIPPSFSEIPGDRVVVEGDDFELAPEAAGSPEVRFQWRFKTAHEIFIDLEDTDRISGTRSSTLSITNAQFADEGYYQCVADNGLGAVRSREMFVRVVDAGINELEVNTVADMNDGNTTSFARLLTEPGPDGVVSLREAIHAANAMNGHNIIRFFAEGVIQPKTPLPGIEDTTGTLLLDGMDSIVLDGTLLGDSGSGLTITSDGNQVKGFRIQGFPGHGIVIEGASENIVTDCRIGTDGETPLSNGVHGVLLVGGASGNRIGGTEPGEGNHIAGNLNAGIALRGAGTVQNQILGNIIGENAEGLPESGNLVAGILLTEGASDNAVGGEERGAANFITRNAGIGIWIVGGSTGRNTVLGNIIFGNGELGIRLFEGGNENVARPEIGAVSPLSGTAPPNSRVDCYVDAQDEGEVFLTTLTADQNGQFGADLDLTPFDGRYLTAIATDANGNTSAFSRPAAIDFTPPVLTLNGEALLSLECGAIFDDPGAAATDNIDGNLFGQIQRRIEDSAGAPVEDLEGAEPGTYSLFYSVSDSSGLAATPVSRTVTILDATAPVLTLNGEASIIVGCGETFEDPGVSAQDSCDSAPTVQVTGAVDMGAPGVYQLTYTATDLAGNSSTAVVRSVTVEDLNVPVVTLNGFDTLTVECGAPFIDPGATASDDCAGDLEVVVVGSVDITRPGEYTLGYRATDAAGNETQGVSRTVIVADTTPPELSLVGDAEMVLNCGDGYSEQGATASDACDPVAEVVITGEFNSNAIGVYTRFYDATDASGNVAETITRTITVVGENPPRITLTGNTEVMVACNSTYADAGANAIDGCDSDISAYIETGNPVNTAVPGTYVVTYNVADGTGVAAAEVTRTVTVLPCATPCDAQCTGKPEDQIDADGDGLSACKEQCVGSSDSDPDSDNDGMSDGFEYRYQLDLRANDAELDLDLDGLTNLDEYLEDASPRNTSDPVRTFHVGQDGVDEPGAGTKASPWRTLAYAHTRLQSAPAGRNQLFIDSGVYVEEVTLLPNLVVRAAPGASVEIVGSVFAPANSTLRDVTISSDGFDTALLFISGNDASIVGCTFNGEFGQNLTGLVVEADATAPSVIEGSIFMNLASGITVEGALPHVRQCQFINIAGSGIALLPGAILPEESPMGDGLNGWNDFSQIGEGIAIANQSAAAASAQWNDWGTEDVAELAARIEGDVDQGNALPEGGAADAAALEVVVFNGDSQARIRTAQVTLNGSGMSLSGATDATGRLAFPLLLPGTWQIAVSATGLIGKSESIDLAAGTRRVANFALIPEEEGEEPIEPGGCPSPGKSGGDGESKRGDLFLLGLLLTGLVAGKVLGTNRRD
jgi:hypothetical protein